MDDPMSACPSSSFSPILVSQMDDPMSACASSSFSPILVLQTIWKCIENEIERVYEAASTKDQAKIDEYAVNCRMLKVINAGLSKMCLPLLDEITALTESCDLELDVIEQKRSEMHSTHVDLFYELDQLLNPEVPRNDLYWKKLITLCADLRSSFKLHVAAQEETVHPHLIRVFKLQAQLTYIRNLFANLPVNVLADFLPWLLSSVSHTEYGNLITIMDKAFPKDNFRQVVSEWITQGIKAHGAAGEPSKKRKIDFVEVSNSHPIDQLYRWHRAILEEFDDIVLEARKIHFDQDLSLLPTLRDRFIMIDNVCSFYSYSKEWIQLRSWLSVLHGVQTVYDILLLFEKLISVVELSKGDIQNHFYDLEIRVLPILRERLNQQSQRELLYKSLLTMTPSMLRNVLPWLAKNMDEEELRMFQINIHLAAPASDNLLASLLCLWACSDHSEDFFLSANLVPCRPLLACDPKRLNYQPQLDGDDCSSDNLNQVVVSDCGSINKAYGVDPCTLLVLPREGSMSEAVGECEVFSMPPVPDLHITSTEKELPWVRSWNESPEVLYMLWREREREPKMRPNYSTIVKSPVTCHRRTLVIWMIDVSTKYKILGLATLFCSVNLFDRFLSSGNINQENLQVAGFTSLYLASKIHCDDPLEIRDILYLTDYVTKSEVLEMEMRMSNYLGSDLDSPTTFNFVWRLVRMVTKKDALLEVVKEGAILESSAFCLAKLALLDSRFVALLPSLVAAACVYLGASILSLQWLPWSPAMQEATSYQLTDLKPCIKALQQLRKEATVNPANKTMNLRPWFYRFTVNP